MPRSYEMVGPGIDSGSFVRGVSMYKRTPLPRFVSIRGVEPPSMPPEGTGANAQTAFQRAEQTHRETTPGRSEPVVVFAAGAGAKGRPQR